MKSATHATCAASAVVSCTRAIRPMLAIATSSAESAIARPKSVRLAEAPKGSEGCTPGRRASIHAPYHISAKAPSSHAIAARRIAACSVASAESARAASAPSQKGRGPSSATGWPAMFGISQSAEVPRAIVSAIPKPAASCVRQGSRPTKPGSA